MLDKDNYINLNENDNPSSNVTDSVIHSSSEEDNIQLKKFGEVPYRFFFVVAYCLCTFANGFQWVTFASIANQFSEGYNIPLHLVNLLSLIYMIEYPFVCLFEGNLVDNYSTRLGIIIAAGCTLGAAGVKLLINKSIAYAYIGQFLAGIFQPALLNSPGQIAANWFREDMRTLICTICCSSDIVGILVGFYWNVLFISGKGEFKDEMFNYLLSQFILVLLFTFPSFLLSKNSPEIPPSPSKIKKQKFTLKNSLKMLLKSKRFIFLLFLTFFTVGYYDIMSTIINNLLSYYEVTGKESSLIYSLSTFFGMVSSIFLSYKVDKSKKFKQYLIILSILGGIFQTLFTLLLEFIQKKWISINTFVISLVLYVLINVIVIPAYTIGMNYACEITYPVGESISGGIMMTMSQISGIGGTFLCQYLLDKYNIPWIVNTILSSFFVFSLIFAILFDEKLDRTEYEKNNSNN